MWRKFHRLVAGGKSQPGSCPADPPRRKVWTLNLWWCWSRSGSWRERSGDIMKWVTWREQINEWELTLEKAWQEGEAQALTFWISSVRWRHRRLWFSSWPCAGLVNTSLQHSESVWKKGSNVPLSAPPVGLSCSPFGGGSFRCRFVPTAPHYSPQQDCWSLPSRREGQTKPVSPDISEVNAGIKAWEWKRSWPSSCAKGLFWIGASTVETSLWSVKESTFHEVWMNLWTNAVKKKCAVLWELMYLVCVGFILHIK